MKAPNKMGKAQLEDRLSLLSNTYMIGYKLIPSVVLMAVIYTRETILMELHQFIKASQFFSKDS